MSMLVYPWPGCEALAAELARALPAQLGALRVRQFPDGETYLRLLTPPRDHRVVLACGLEQPDQKCTGIYFAATTARELGARDVGLVAPYLAYMRQDARFHPGEAVASRAFAQRLSATVDWLATLDPHLHRHAALGEIYSIPTAVASATAAIARWIGAHVAAPVVIGPDAESRQWAERIAAGAGCEFRVLDKHRAGDHDVTITLPDLAGLESCTPVLVDDIISTGRTLATAASLLRAHGLRAPVCVGVHALFSAGAEAAFAAAGVERIVTCNSVIHPSNAIDILPDITRAAREAAGPDAA
jgi:ribose-phosphate pyrophosphokinase